jgi:diguanylate cyclase (GGDEF)-like protein/PAS domain S-box-containing protein
LAQLMAAGTCWDGRGLDEPLRGLGEVLGLPDIPISLTAADGTALGTTARSGGLNASATPHRVNLWHDRALVAVLELHAPEVAADESSAAMLAVYADWLALEVARCQAWQRLVHSEARLRAVAEGAADVIALLEIGVGLTHLSGGCERVLGACASELVGQDWATLAHADDQPLIADSCAFALQSGAPTVFRFRLQRGQSEHRWVEATVQALPGGEATRTLHLILRDVEAQQRLMQEMQTQLSRDPLTGAFNRVGLARLFETARERNEPFTLVYVDLDHFKQINDTLGHGAGDQLLRAVAGRLQHALRAGDVVARIGGDEFVVIAPSAHPNVRVIEAKLEAALRDPFNLGAGRTLGLRASVGSARFPEDGTQLEALLAHADARMYDAKRLRKN